MLRLRSSILGRFLPSPAAYPISPLHRLLSAASSPTPAFAVEQYLVDTCGLTRAQALKAAPKLSHLKSPTKLDAVLAFLASLGLSSADVAAVVAKDPVFLCTGVDTVLGPNVVGLTGLGLSHTEIARLISVTPNRFRCRSIISNLPYYHSLFGSIENLPRFLKQSYSLLTCSLEKVVKPNVAFLRECGLSDCDVSKLCLSKSRVLKTNPQRVRAMVACAERLGIPPGSVMFMDALHAVAFVGEEKIAAKVDYLKNAFRWSDAEVNIAVSKLPTLLSRSKDVLQIRSEFLISEVGLEPAYIAHRPALLTYSLEGRLRPRYYVVKFLKENGLLDRYRSFYSAVMVTEMVFMEKSYPLTMKPHHTSLKIMQPLAKGKCLLDSDLHEPKMGMKMDNCVHYIIQ